MIIYKIERKKPHEFLPNSFTINIRAKENAIQKILKNPERYRNPERMLKFLEQEIDLAETHGYEISIPNNKKKKGQQKN